MTGVIAGVDVVIADYEDYEALRCRKNISHTFASYSFAVFHSCFSSLFSLRIFLFQCCIRALYKFVGDFSTFEVEKYCFLLMTSCSVNIITYFFAFFLI